MPFHIFGLGGLDAFARGGFKENARIAQRDGLVAKVGYDEAHRHHVVGDIVDAENGVLFFGVVGLDSDGHVLVWVNLDRGKGSGRLHRGRRVVGGKAGSRQPDRKNRKSTQNSHRARLYHSRVIHPIFQVSTLYD